jgi:hypothetical protein
MELVEIDPEASRAEILCGFYLNGDDLVFFLNNKIDF